MKFSKAAKVNIYSEIKSLTILITLAILFRSFVMEPFYIPSSSMEDTLLEGDYIFSSKFAYGFSKHSLPFSPDIYDGRIFERQAKRGDIVIFWPPHSNEKRFIKRVIGLPGDIIEIKDKELFINGKASKLKYIGDMEASSGRMIKKYQETTFDNVSYNVLFEDKGIRDDFGPLTVQDGHYFCMGDNRDNSGDSRMIGTVPANNLISRADIIFFSTGEQLWISNTTLLGQIKQFYYWVASIRPSRMFNLLKQKYDSNNE